MNTKQKGNFGELIARIYLILHFYKILDRNYLTKTGEIDIVAEKNKTIVFVEVKYRTNAEMGMPREAVDYYKQRHIQKTALWYLKHKNLFDRDIRFDVIEILGYKITHLKNAF